MKDGGFGAGGFGAGGFTLWDGFGLRGDAEAVGDAGSVDAVGVGAENLLGDGSTFGDALVDGLVDFVWVGEGDED